MLKFDTLSRGFGAAADCDGIDLMRIDVGEIKDRLRREGTILLRRTGLDLGGLDAFSARICSFFHVNGNTGRRAANSDDTTQSVQPGTEALNPHCEWANQPLWPEVVWFYCERPAAEGGETTLCDGVEVLARLSAPTRALFLERRIRYTNRFAPAMWQRVIGTDRVDEAALVLGGLAQAAGGAVSFAFEGDVLRLEYVAQAAPRARGGAPAFANALLAYDDADLFTATFEDGSAIPGDALAEALEAARAAEATIRWAPTDLVMIDNRRVMHGRRSFTDERRRLFTRLGNLGS